MEVEVKKIGTPYNQWGCGYRLLFLIKYERDSWTDARYEADCSIHLNRRLNKLVEYWNYHGNANGREKILIKTMYVPIESLGAITQEDYTAIETESYGHILPHYLSKGNLYYKEREIKVGDN